ncbi:uncharacterized protein CBL_02328 [Carabus blaptoides fortunei]
METLKELLPFLQIGARLDLKAVATKHILDLTGNQDGLALIRDYPQILISLLMLTQDNNATIAKDACLALVNISANEKGASALLNLKIELANTMMKPPDNIVLTSLKFVMDPNSLLADPACMILSNLSRPSALTDKVIDFILDSGLNLDEIVNVFTKNEYNKKGAKLHYLAPMFSNLSQSSRIRKYLLDKSKCVIQRLLPFTEYNDSILRRGGIVGTLKNCCFEEEYHSWLLSDAVDILPRLLLPLAGSEEFDDDDNDKLPPELQYLSEDKVREADPDIRCMLLEAIIQLCAKKECREYVRDKNTYVILRELHKWEKDRKALLTCENLVDILIRTEEEIGKDNIKDVEVPEDLMEKFEKMDEDFINDK